ncbi:ATP-binding protein [archaeon]|nr:MAG: ATP-binding protein [archaeon]
MSWDQSTEAVSSGGEEASTCCERSCVSPSFRRRRGHRSWLQRRRPSDVRPHGARARERSAGLSSESESEGSASCGVLTRCDDAHVVAAQYPPQADAAAAVQEWIDFQRTVVGLSAVKSALTEVWLLPRVVPSRVLVGIRALPCTLLLHGPPGTGKSHAVRTFTAATKRALISITASSIVSKWAGEGEKAIARAFSRAARSAPSVLFLDELDGMGTSRGGSNSGGAVDEGDTSARRLLTELLIRMSTMQDVNARVPGAPVLLVAATNRPQDLDAALLRRFDRIIACPLPSVSERLEQMLYYTRHVACSLTDDEWLALAVRTEGWNGAELRSLAREAAMQPLREQLHAFLTLNRNPGTCARQLFPPCSSVRGVMEHGSVVAGQSVHDARCCVSAAPAACRMQEAAQPRTRGHDEHDRTLRESCAPAGDHFSGYCVFVTPAGKMRADCDGAPPPLSVPGGEFERCCSPCLSAPCPQSRCNLFVPHPCHFVRPVLHSPACSAFERVRECRVRCAECTYSSNVH